MVSQVPPLYISIEVVSENVVQWMSMGHFVQYEHGRKEPGAWFIYARRDRREDLRVHCPYRLPELQSQKIQTTFLLHTFLKVVVKPVTTGIAEGSEQEDRLKAALCRIWDTKCNQRLAILFPSSSEVSQVQQIGREPGWVQNNLWRCQWCSTRTKKQASDGIQLRRGTKRKQIALKHLITCFP